MANLAWIDLETTGLNPLKGSILELGCIITDKALNELDRALWVLHYDGPCDHPHPDELLSACRESSLSLSGVAESLNAFMDRNDALLSPMCGSSIHFDRGWLGIHHATILVLFHYRNFDVTMFRIVADLLGLECPPKQGRHRAIPDLEDSIALGRWGLNLLRKGSQ